MLLRMRVFILIGFFGGLLSLLSIAACPDGSGHLRPTASEQPSTVDPTPTAQPTPTAPCSDLEYCACDVRTECMHVIGDCVCPFDYKCEHLGQGDCACGGGPWWGCQATRCSGGPSDVLYCSESAEYDEVNDCMVCIEDQ